MITSCLKVLRTSADLAFLCIFLLNLKYARLKKISHKSSCSQAFNNLLIKKLEPRLLCRKFMSIKKKKKKKRRINPQDVRSWAISVQTRFTGVIYEETWDYSTTLACGNIKCARPLLHLSQGWYILVHSTVLTDTTCVLNRCFLAPGGLSRGFIPEESLERIQPMQVKKHLFGTTGSKHW